MPPYESWDEEPYPLHNTAATPLYRQMVLDAMAAKLVPDGQHALTRHADEPIITPDAAAYLHSWFDK